MQDQDADAQNWYCTFTVLLCFVFSLRPPDKVCQGSIVITLSVVCQSTLISCLLNNSELGDIFTKLDTNIKHDQTFCREQVI